MLAPKAAATTRAVILAVGGYSFCSATLLLANKLLMSIWPFPSLCAVGQLIFAMVAIKLLKDLGLIDADDLTKEKTMFMLPYIAIFSTCLFANMKALEHSNVDTVIVFRACTPLAVSFLDWLLLGRALPTLRSWICLVSLALGAAFYVGSDKQFVVEGLAGYTWVTIYFILICAEMTYGKHLTSAANFKSKTWGLVRFTNTLGIPPLLAMALVNDEPARLQGMLPSLDLGVGAWIIMLFTCVAGLAIGYSGFHCREMLSATSFTTVGVVNKLATVLLNVFIWDQHASTAGLGALVVCLLGGTFYQQAPMREQPPTVAVTAVPLVTVEPLPATAPEPRATE